MAWSILFSEFFCLSRVNITGFGMSRVLEIAYICIYLLILSMICLLYTSDAADDMQCVDLGGRRIIKKLSILG